MLAVSVRPDGAQVAVASLDCQITFFDIRTGIQSGSVEGRMDLAHGRRTSDKITAKTTGFAKLVLGNFILSASSSIKPNSTGFVLKQVFVL